MAAIPPASPEQPDSRALARSRAVGRAIEQALESAIAASSDEADGLLTEVETGLLAGTADDYETLEVKRRVAEARLSLFYSMPTSHELARSAWVALERLGFSSPEREASMLVYWAKHLVVRGRPEEAANCALRLESLARQSLGCDMPWLEAHFVSCSEGIRAAIGDAH